MMLTRLKQMLGLDIREAEYAYGYDAEYGYVSSKKIPDRWLKTTCGYCSVGCGMKVGVKGNEIVSVQGDVDHPVNEGHLCPKGLSEHLPLKSKHRLVAPLMRGADGHFKRVTWDLAYDEMVGRIGQVQARYGKEAFAVLSTGQLVTEELYALGKLVQLGFGTSNYDGNTTLCMSSAVVGYKQSFGSDGPPGSYQGLQVADVVFLIGANIADNHPILWHHLKQNANRTLIVCDPRKSKTAMFADLFLPIKPRRDMDLLNGLIHLAIKNGRVDRAFVDAHTIGFDALKKHSEAYPPNVVAECTGLSVDLILKTFEAIASARNTFFAWTMGVNHSTQGSDTVSLINTLALITGNIGRTGAAPMSITGQCNAMGSREFSFTSALPGYRNFESAPDRQALAHIWDIDEAQIPQKRGFNYPEIIDAILDGHIKALWVVATNPLMSFPDQARLEAALAKLDFLAVQDGFETPTTALADLVLPAAVWGEKEGCFTNSERRVSRVQTAVSPPGEAKPDFEIFLDLARRLQVFERLFPGWQTPADAFEEMRRVSEGCLCDYSGMTYQKMLDWGGIQWPCNADYEVGCDSLYTNGIFQTPDGHANLVFAHGEALPEEPGGLFPLTLNTGRTVEHWHTGTKTREVPLLNRLVSGAWVEINPRLARRENLDVHDLVSIVSARGRVDGLHLRLTETIHPDQIFVPFHFVEHCINQLTVAAFDPKSGEPNYKQCAVRIERYRK